MSEATQFPYLMIRRDKPRHQAICTRRLVLLRHATKLWQRLLLSEASKSNKERLRWDLEKCLAVCALMTASRGVRQGVPLPDKTLRNLDLQRCSIEVDNAKIQSKLDAKGFRRQIMVYVVFVIYRIRYVAFCSSQSIRKAMLGM